MPEISCCIYDNILSYMQLDTNSLTQILPSRMFILYWHKHYLSMTFIPVIIQPEPACVCEWCCVQYRVVKFVQSIVYARRRLTWTRPKVWFSISMKLWSSSFLFANVAIILCKASCKRKETFTICMCSIVFICSCHLFICSYFIAVYLLSIIPWELYTFIS